MQASIKVYSFGRPKCQKEKPNVIEQELRRK